MGYSRRLTELTRVDEPRFGGKSAGLGELIRAGVPVPPGFALSIEAFEAFMSESGLAGRAADSMAALDDGDLAAIDAAARGLGAEMRRAAVPESVRGEIAACYAELGPGDPPVAVRSSAVGEDSAVATYAGQQETYLWIRGADRVCQAVRDCWASLFSAPAISYRLRLGATSPAMGVTVQPMVDAEVSGVMFTCNPLSGDPSMVAVNASWGLGLAVVAGEVSPDDFLVSKVTSDVVRARVQPKAVEYVPDPSGQGPIRVEVPAARRDARCLDDGQLADLAAVAKRVQRYFGSHQDIEWAIARDSGELFVLQSRPVTALAKRDKKATPTDALSMVMHTFGADAT